jgi:hypothetical protein
VSNYDIDGDDNGNGKDNDGDGDGDKIVRACYCVEDNAPATLDRHLTAAYYGGLEWNKVPVSLTIFQCRPKHPSRRLMPHYGAIYRHPLETALTWMPGLKDGDQPRAVDLRGRKRDELGGHGQKKRKKRRCTRPWMRHLSRQAAAETLRGHSCRFCRCPQQKSISLAGLGSGRVYRDMRPPRRPAEPCGPCIV